MKLDLSKPFDLQRAKEYFNKLVESESKIELKKYSPKRSLSQNAYLHVLFQVYCLRNGLYNRTSQSINEKAFRFFYG